MSLEQTKESPVRAGEILLLKKILQSVTTILNHIIAVKLLTDLWLTNENAKRGSRRVLKITRH